MEQPTNDLRQAPTRLETAERELAMSKATAEANVEVAKRELAESKRELAESKRELAESKAKLEVAEANRAAHAFLSDEWKFYNEEVVSARAMVTSAWAMVLKLTPAPGTYSPPPPSHTHNTQPPCRLLGCFGLEGGGLVVF